MLITAAVIPSTVVAPDKITVSPAKAPWATWVIVSVLDPEAAVASGFAPSVTAETLKGVILLTPPPSSIKSFAEVPTPIKSLPSRFDQLNNDLQVPVKAVEVVLIQPPIF